MFSSSPGSLHAVSRRRVRIDELDKFINTYYALADARGVEVPPELEYRVEAAKDKELDEGRFPVLSLKKSGIGDDQVKILALALWDLPIVGCLDLRFNNISHHGVSALMELMRHQMAMVLSIPAGHMVGEEEDSQLVCLHMVRVEGNPVDANTGILRELNAHTQAAMCTAARLYVAYAFADNDRGKKGYLIGAEAESAVYDVLGHHAKLWRSTKKALADNNTHLERVKVSEFQVALVMVLQAKRLIPLPGPDAIVLLQTLANIDASAATSTYTDTSDHTSNPTLRPVKPSFDSFRRSSSTSSMSSNPNRSSSSKRFGHQGNSRRLGFLRRLSEGSFSDSSSSKKPSMLSRLLSSGSGRWRLDELFTSPTTQRRRDSNRSDPGENINDDDDASPSNNDKPVGIQVQEGSISPSACLDGPQHNESLSPSASPKVKLSVIAKGIEQKMTTNIPSPAISPTLSPSAGEVQTAKKPTSPSSITVDSLIQQNHRTSPYPSPEPPNSADRGPFLPTHQQLDPMTESTVPAVATRRTTDSRSITMSMGKSPVSHDSLAISPLSVDQPLAANQHLEEERTRQDVCPELGDKEDVEVTEDEDWRQLIMSPTNNGLSAVRSVTSAEASIPPIGSPMSGGTQAAWEEFLTRPSDNKYDQGQETSVEAGQHQGGEERYREDDVQVDADCSCSQSIQPPARQRRDYDKLDFTEPTDDPALQGNESMELVVRTLSPRGPLSPSPWRSMQMTVPDANALGELELDDGQLTVSMRGAQEIDLRAGVEGRGLGTRLHTLTLSYNQLTTIDAQALSFSHFPHLRHMDLSHNLIGDMECKNGPYPASLRSLDLTNNVVHNITGLESCSNLQRLLLSSNRLRFIDGLHHLVHLMELDVSHNLIAKPVGLRALSFNKNLQILYIEGNPCCNAHHVHTAIANICPRLLVVDQKTLAGRKRQGRDQKVTSPNPTAQLHQTIPRTKQLQADRERSQLFRTMVKRRREEEEVFLATIMKAPPVVDPYRQRQHVEELSNPRYTTQAKPVKRNFKLAFGRHTDAHNCPSPLQGPLHKSTAMNTTTTTLPTGLPQHILEKLKLARQQSGSEQVVDPSSPTQRIPKSMWEEFAEADDVSTMRGKRISQEQQSPSSFVMGQETKGDDYLKAWEEPLQDAGSPQEEESVHKHDRRPASEEPSNSSLRPQELKPTAAASSRASAFLIQHRLDEWLLDMEQDMATTQTALGVVLKMVDAQEGREMALDRFQEMCQQLRVLDEPSVPEGLVAALETTEEGNEQLNMVKNKLEKGRKVKKDLQDLIELLTKEPDGSPAVASFADYLHTAHDVAAVEVSLPGHVAIVRDTGATELSSLSLSASEDPSGSVKESQAPQLLGPSQSSELHASIEKGSRRDSQIHTFDGAPDAVSEESSIFSVPSAPDAVGTPSSLVVGSQLSKGAFQVEMGHDWDDNLSPGSRASEGDTRGLDSRGVSPEAQEGQGINSKGLPVEPSHSRQASKALDAYEEHEPTVLEDASPNTGLNLRRSSLDSHEALRSRVSSSESYKDHREIRSSIGSYSSQASSLKQPHLKTSEHILSYDGDATNVKECESRTSRRESKASTGSCRSRLLSSEAARSRQSSISVPVDNEKPLTGENDIQMSFSGSHSFRGFHHHQDLSPASPTISHADEERSHQSHRRSSVGSSRDDSQLASQSERPLPTLASTYSNDGVSSLGDNDSHHSDINRRPSTASSLGHVSPTEPTLLVPAYSNDNAPDIEQSPNLGSSASSPLAQQAPCSDGSGSSPHPDVSKEMQDSETGLASRSSSHDLPNEEDQDLLSGGPRDGEASVTPSHDRASVSSQGTKAEPLDREQQAPYEEDRASDYVNVGTDQMNVSSSPDYADHHGEDASQAPESEPLIWKQGFDRTHNHFFYYNMMTDESQWEEPDEPFIPYEEGESEEEEEPNGGDGASQEEQLEPLAEETEEDMDRSLSSTAQRTAKDGGDPSGGDSSTKEEEEAVSLEREEHPAQRSNDHDSASMGERLDHSQSTTAGEENVSSLYAVEFSDNSRTSKKRASLPDMFKAKLQSFSRRSSSSGDHDAKSTSDAGDKGRNDSLDSGSTSSAKRRSSFKDLFKMSSSKSKDLDNNSQKDAALNNSTSSHGSGHREAAQVEINNGKWPSLRRKKSSSKDLSHQGSSMSVATKGQDVFNISSDSF